MNITQLRDTITSLLSASPNLIGIYTLPTAATIPAIYTVGQQSVPSEWKVQGLEVTIGQFPEIVSRTPLNGTVKVNQLWEVILTQYSPGLATLSSAMERMVRRFPDSTPRYFRGNDVTYQRCRFVVPDLILLSLYPA